MASFESIRALALALPEAMEADHHGLPSGRVRGKIFYTWRATPARLMVKLDLEDQHNLSLAHPGVVEPVAGHWGRGGATFVTLERADAGLVRMLMGMAWTRATRRRLRREA